MSYPIEVRHYSTAQTKLSLNNILHSMISTFLPYETGITHNSENSCLRLFNLTMQHK